MVGIHARMSDLSTKTLCFDLDGTLCSAAGRDYELAEPFPWAIRRVNELAREGHRIIIMTARGAATGIDWEALTRDQLERWGVTYHELRFGKPRADVFIDDRGVHTDVWRRDDAFGPPGYDRGNPQRLPIAPAGHVSTVVEVGRTFGGRPTGFQEHCERAREVALAAGIRHVPTAAEIRSAVEAVLPDPALLEGDDATFAIRLADPAGLGYLDIFEPGAPHEPGVTCRRLSQALEGLVHFCARQGGGVAIDAGIRDDGAWPLRSGDGGELEDGLGGTLATVNGDRVTLAPSRPLPSVAARRVEALAGDIGLSVETAPISADALTGADEAFVAGAPFCLLPLAGVDGRPFGAGAAPGPVTRRLLDAWSGEVGLDVAAQTAALLERAKEPAPCL
jgi:branched-subunit amino acid aminotransferase/4-amino-4-deoxychorismate lyase